LGRRKAEGTEQLDLNTESEFRIRGEDLELSISGITLELKKGGRDSV